MAGLSGFSYYKEITIDNAYVDADIANFPVKVSIAADADIGGECRADGFDVQFANSDNSETLTFERLPGFTVASEQATGVFYVLVPTVATATDTVIRCYYGKAGATDVSSPENTFLAANGWSAVWHLEESTGPYLDATSNNNDTVGGTNPTQVTGKVGKGQDFEAGTPTFLYTASSTSLNIDADDDFTFSCWVNLESNDITQFIIRKQLTAPYYFFGLTSGSPYCQLYDGTDATTCTNWDAALGTGTWYHLVARCDRSESDGLQVIVNATLPAPYNSNPTSIDDLTNTTGLSIGSKTTDADNPFDGILDELRFSKVARPNAWIKFEYYNSKDGDLQSGYNQLTWGAETGGGGGPADSIHLIWTKQAQI